MAYQLLGIDLLYAGKSSYAYLPTIVDTFEEAQKYIKSRQGIRSGFGRYAILNTETGIITNDTGIELNEKGLVK